MRAFLPVGLLCALAAAFLVALGDADSCTNADIVFVNRGEVFTLDPQRMSYQQDLRLGYALYEGLLRWNPHDFSISPAAADLPQVSDDHLTYRFRIGADAKWSNGAPLTADDFVYSFRRLLLPDTAADYSSLLFDIKGAREFFAFRVQQLGSFPQHASGLPEPERLQLARRQHDAAALQFLQSVGVRAEPGNVLAIDLVRPVAYLQDLLCFAPTYPVYRPCVEGWPKDSLPAPRAWTDASAPPLSQCSRITFDPDTGRLRQDHTWARPGEMISNGPYELQRWRYKRDLLLKRNPWFRDQQLLRNDSVLVLTIEDPNTAVLAYNAGGIDWLNDLSVDYLPDLLDLQSSRVTSHPAFATDFFSFNCRSHLADGRENPFALPAVRRAFSLATDRHAIVTDITRERERIMTTLVPPDSITGYPTVLGLNHDVARARDELGLAGWQDRNNDSLVEDEAGRPFPAIDLVFTTNSARYKWIALELKAQWERALGVRVEPRPLQSKFFKDELRAGKFMIARGQWYGDYSDPTSFLNINITGDGNNDRGFSDPSFDALLLAADLQPSPQLRLAKLAEAEHYLFTQNPPLIPICQLQQTYMYDPRRLAGLTSHPRLIQYLWRLERVNDSSAGDPAP